MPDFSLSSVNMTPGAFALALGVALLAWALLRLSRVERGVIGSSLLLSLGGLGLQLASMVMAALHQPSATLVLGELAILVLGAVAIRVLVLSFCRAILPGWGVTPPRIIEDLLILFSYLTWSLVRLHAAGVDLSGIVTTSAVITGIVAFSAQETLGNILGGLALQLDNSIHIGDWVEVEGVRGKVIEVHWRHTAVRNTDGEIIVIPNALLMKSKMRVMSSLRVTQWRQSIAFTVDQDVPPQDVIAVVQQAIADSEIHGVGKTPSPTCVLKRFEQGLAHYAFRYWLLDPANDDLVNSSVLVHIYAALKRKGFALGRPGFDALVTSDSDERGARLRDREIDRRLKALESIELFSVLSSSERSQLAATLTEAMFVEGDLITRQGAEAHSLYILVTGEVDVWFESSVAGRPRQYVTTLRPGQVFGEMGLMTGEQRSATVMARTHAECFRLDKSSFELILRNRPELANSLGGILSERSVRKGFSESGAPHNAPQTDTIVSAIRRFFGLQG